MLNFLKKDTASLEIDLEPQGTYKPGDTIQARLALQAKEEVKIKQFRVAFYCEVKRRVRTHVSGRNPHTDYHWKTNREEILSQVIMDEGVVPPHLSQKHIVTLGIPDGALPTASGKIIQINWWVKATLDRPNAVDINAESGLVVERLLPGGTPAQNEGEIEYPGSNTRDVDISFWLPRSHWALGETVHGRLSVLAHANVKFSDIRVELVQFESVPESSGNDSSVGTSTEVAKKTEMRAGQSLDFPFQIRIPDDGAPTLDTGYCSITWKLKGVLARQLATDYHTDTVLEVYSRA